MKAILLILAALCFSETSALECHAARPSDFMDEDANQEVLQFFDTLAKKFEGREASQEELVQVFEDVQMNNEKANDLLCEFASNFGITSSNIHHYSLNAENGWKCTICKGLFWLVGVLSGKHAPETLEFLRSILKISCSKMTWVPGVKGFCEKYEAMGNIGLSMAENVIKGDGKVVPDHICGALQVC